MFNFLKKDEIVSFADGEMTKIEDVADEVFSSKSMGDGFAIKFTGNKIVSPVDGEIKVAFPTGHAIGICSKDKEILVHIGIDTVNLNGEGFNVLVKPNDKVKKGQVLVEVDASFLLEKGYDPTTVFVLTSKGNIDCLKIGEKVLCNEKVAMFK